MRVDRIQRPQRINQRGTRIHRDSDTERLRNFLLAQRGVRVERDATIAPRRHRNSQRNQLPYPRRAESFSKFAAERFGNP